MGGPLSVTLSDIHMTRTKNNVVRPEKPLFYRRFVDDITNRRKKNEHHIIFENLNKYHPKINLTIEVNPCKFLDTKIINKKGNITTEVFCKMSKLPVHWSSRVPKRYKRIVVIGDLHRSKRISSNFEMKIKVVKCKFRNADYRPKFLNSVIHQFFTPKNKGLFITPADLFEESKPVILVEIPYCEENENAFKHFIEKFKAFTNQRYRIVIKWTTRKVKSLSNVKSINSHPSCVIYRGKCSCREEYIRETERNVEKRCSQHNNSTEKTEPARHLSNDIGHLFAWEILMPAPKEKRTRKNLEAFFIAVQKPLLNEQVKSSVFHLFRNGVT